MAVLCVILARRRHKKLFEEMEEAGKQGAKLLEIRLDYLNREPRLREILARKPCPLIATVRRREDGGQWRDSEEKRERLLRAAIADGFDYVDLEADVAQKIKRYGTSKRIISYHNLREVPDHLPELHAKLSKLDADIVKIAARANHPADNFTMFRLLRQVSIPTVAICMGDLGIPSRVLSAKFGSPYTYAAFSDGRIVAPGLLTRSEFTDIYDYERLNSETEVYGVMGDPIAHSLSPLVHNACFRALDLNKVYVPFRVPKECLEGFLREIDVAPVLGLSVTIPHKQAVLQFGLEADPLVRSTHSANTIVANASGRYLYNTDGPAALEAIEAAIPPDPETGRRTLSNRTVLILGAGGVARTIAHSLRRHDAIVSITSRDEDKAKRLAADFNGNVVEWNQRHARHSDVLINCTPVGMYPNMDESPFHPSGFHENMVVFDTVYNPEHTLLLKEAAERGCIVVTGVEMFIRQAEAQFKLFTGMDPPPGLMATLVREELSPARNMLREARLKAGKTE